VGDTPSRSPKKPDWTGCVLDGRYRIGTVLGRGGMGTVYAARDERLDRPVVVKVPQTRFLDDEEFILRFDREIRSLITLPHPHIVKVLDVGKASPLSEPDPVPYVVLEFLAGGSLKSRIDAHGGRLAPEEVASWLPDVARALDFVHRQRVVHRDIKPGNILFDTDGNVYVADFGIAKALGGIDTGVTATGVTPGSPDYMAPEVVTGHALGPTYDEYGLAVVVYEALAGRLPYPRSDSPLQAIYRAASAPAAPLGEAAPNVSPETAAVVMRGLSKDPAARYASCGEFADAFVASLAAASGTRASPPPASGTRVTEAAGRRSREGTAAAAGVEPRKGPARAPGARTPPPPPPRRGKGLVVALVLVATAAVAVAAAFGSGWLGKGSSSPSSPSTTSPPPAAPPEPGPTEPPPPPPKPEPKPEAKPWIEVSAPAEGAVVRSRTGEVAGRLLDPRRGTLTVDGKPTEIVKGEFVASVRFSRAGPRDVAIVFTPEGGEPLALGRAVRVELPPLSLSVRSPAEGEHVPPRPVRVEGVVAPAEDASVEVAGRPATLAAGGAFWATADLAGYGPREIRVRARAEGVEDAEALVHVVVDPPDAPVLFVGAPANGASIEDGPVRVTGRVTGAWKDEVRVNGKSVPLRDGAFQTSIDPPALGAFDFVVECEADGRPAVQVWRSVQIVPTPLRVTIDAPKDGETLGAREVRVRGTVRGAAASVTVNGERVTLQGEAFDARVRAEADGSFRILVEAARRRGDAETASRTVEVDATPPRLRLTSPAGTEATVSGDKAVVAGVVEDAHPASVSAGGKAFPVAADGSFRLTVPVTKGRRTQVTLRGRDQAGHESAETTVRLRTDGPQILGVPGDYATVTAALEAANAGDTVELARGTHRDNVRLKSGVALAGVDRDGCRLEAADPSRPVIAASDVKDAKVRSLTIATRAPRAYLLSPQAGFTTQDAGKAWVIEVARVDAGSTASARGVAPGTRVVRINGVATERQAHAEAAALRASLESPSYSLDYEFENGARVRVTSSFPYAFPVVNSSVDVSNCRLSQVLSGGLLFSGASTRFSVDGLVADGCTRGFVAAAGAQGTLRNGRFEDSNETPITALGRGTVLDVVSCTVTSSPGDGVLYVSGTQGHVRDGEVSRCEWGLHVLGSLVDASGGTYGLCRQSGIFYDFGSTGTISSNTCDRNAWHGIDTCGLGTNPSVRGNTCRYNSRFGVVW
jgi:serine/threonine protein kinase